MKWLFAFVLMAPAMAGAAIKLPTNLTSDDRKILLAILGFGSQSKLLSSPVPLGGREGFEVGVSSEYLAIDDLAGLGAKEPRAKGEYNAVAIGFGKGLPYNVDTFFHLTPLPQTEGFFAYGAQLRWGFYEFQKFPGLLSVVFHGSGANFLNQLNARTTGADLVMTIAMDNLALYFGGGPIRTIGTFVGGTGGITAEGVSIDEDLKDTHTVFGLSIGWGKLFAALEVDRVTQSAYSARLGWRF